MLGSSIIQPCEKELEIKKIARRSIVTSKNIGKGEILTEENLTFKQAGTGIPVDLWDLVIGKKATKNLKQNTFLNIVDFE